jgi:transposase-like protein
MNDNNRRYFSPEQKVAILREHLIEGKAVSDLCDKHHIHPTVFYQWQRQFFENGTAAFESRQSRSRISAKNSVELGFRSLLPDGAPAC